MKQTRQYKFTIVIPTFQRANLLENTIKSCLMQNHENFQLLISNNFSLDNSSADFIAIYCSDSIVNYLE